MSVLLSNSHTVLKAGGGGGRGGVEGRGLGGGGERKGKEGMVGQVIGGAGSEV